MQSKKPTKYLRCSKCKGSDFHYMYMDGAKYRCNTCQTVTKG